MKLIQDNQGDPSARKTITRETLGTFFRGTWALSYAWEQLAEDSYKEKNRRQKTAQLRTVAIQTTQNLSTAPAKLQG